MATKKPNIIYILGDDHRAEFLQSAGYPGLKTPGLDALAADGIRFDQAFCTSPVCTPSRCCHYLGQWERRHAINFNSGSALARQAWEKSFPAVMKRHGYYLGWVGKNHVPAGEGGYGGGYLESFFDYWYGNHNHSGFYVKEFPRGRIYRNAVHDTQVEVFEEGVMHFLDPDTAEGERFRAECTSPLPRRPIDKPFCLCVTFNLPHPAGTGTMQMRPTDDELYRLTYRDGMNEFPLPETYVPFLKIREPRLPRHVYNGIQLPSYDYVRSPETLRERLVRICQTVTGMDWMVGHLRAKLKELSLEDNTVILFSTDHGIHHGEHGLGGKSLMYEEDLRIPLILYDPRMPASVRGRVCSDTVVVPDLAPTILSLAGLPVPDSMQGTDLAPGLLDPSAGSRHSRSEFFAEALMDIQNYPRSECVRTREWKYIRYFARTEDPAQSGQVMRGTLDSYDGGLTGTLYGNEPPIYEELYHLKEDPREKINLLKEGSRAARSMAGELQSRLLELGRQCRHRDDPILTVPVPEA